jgi:hypothetical protein
MLAEVNTAKAFLIKKFGSVEQVESGTYAVPYETSKGKAFMKVIISEDMRMSGFDLFKDEEMKVSWHD